MPRKTVSTRRPKPPLLVRGETATLDKFRRFSDAERLTFANAIDVLLRGWERLSDEDRCLARTKETTRVNA